MGFTRLCGRVCWSLGNQDPDYADSSFGIAIDALRRCQAGLREGLDVCFTMECILVEQDKVAFADLEQFAAIRRPSS